jgi:hypothetical protein
VSGGGVDQLHPGLGELALELDGDSEQAAGEARVVVGEELARKPVRRARPNETGPGCLPGRRLAGDRGEQEAGVVVQAVDDPGRLAIGELELGAVDLPEVVRRLPLEAPRRLQPPLRLRGDEVVAPERAVDRRYRRRLDPRPPKLGVDATRTPARMPPAQLDDPRLERGLDPRRRGTGTTRARPKPGDALLPVPAPVTVETRPRDPVPGAHLGHRLPGALSSSTSSFNSSIDTTFKAMPASRCSLRLRGQGSGRDRPERRCLRCPANVSDVPRTICLRCPGS